VQRNHAGAQKFILAGIAAMSGMAKNLNHPSLHAKKYDKATDLWQARVNRDWRFYFLIRDDTYLIVTITPHPN
jgi:plasmid maintenance system killer protein